MIIVFSPEATDPEIELVRQKVIGFGYEPRLIQGTEQRVLACLGDETAHKSLEALCVLPGVDNVLPVQKRYKMASREFHRSSSVVSVGGHKIGAGHFLMIAGPCAVESEDQLRSVARGLLASGVHVLRAGAFKPRTSPYDFQGMGYEGLALLAAIKEEFKMAIVTEVVGVDQVAATAEVADMLQIGARNSQNYRLLAEVAGAGKPVLLKRGLASTVEEWLLAAEYLIVNGCRDVVLCERGIRTFERSYRFTLDVGAVAVAKRETHLPVVVDPSHPAGRVDLVLPLARAGIGVGADGLLVETHPAPTEAVSDATQQVPLDQFAGFMDQLRDFIALSQAQPLKGA